MLSSEQAKSIVERWKDKFPSAESVMSSYDRYEARIPAPNRSPESFERWLSEDADQQHVRAAVMSVLPVQAESQPHDLPLPPGTEASAIARGDIHDWTNIDHEDPTQHAAHCPRCQLGMQGHGGGLGAALATARAKYGAKS